VEEFVAFLESPLGIIEIKGTATYISSVQFTVDADSESENLPEIVIQCKLELQEYFLGKRKEFSVDVKANGSDFQNSVWAQLKKIPYGETKSYGEIAQSMKGRNMSRAVGHANGKNPIAIIIPCHRVIGQSGKLTGYAGGMWRKQWLLELEGNTSGKNPTLALFYCFLPSRTTGGGRGNPFVASQRPSVTSKNDFVTP
jgi:methylated-DNA-[protein]-cysteine S-methyltransferase